ncbi:MAG: hypothetical protein U1E14_00795 [Geminicoccaceae bacterium]
MAQPASYRAMYTYAWDLIDEGFAAVADRFRSVNANTVALATSYHAGKFIRPHGRSGKVYFPEDGTIYFRHRPERYGRVTPLPNALLKEIDPLAELARVAPDLRRTGWIVCCHNTPLGQLHPELIARNCFGDGFIYSLNPAHPDVRAYIVALCRDVTEAYELEGISLETPGWLPWEHGYHHEFQFLPLNEWLGLLLGMDFSPATLAAARAAGIDAEPLRAKTAAALEGWLSRDLHVDGERARDWLLADMVGDPTWAAFLTWRCRCVADLIAEIRAAVPRGTEVRVIPSVQRPTARGWVEGSDLGMLAEAADALEFCAYEPSAAAIAADVFDVRRRAGAAAKINAIMRPAHPDIGGGTEAVAAARALRAAGVAGLAFYNYGHWRAPGFDHVRAAFTAWDSL